MCTMRVLTVFAVAMNDVWIAISVFVWKSHLVKCHQKAAAAAVTNMADFPPQKPQNLITSLPVSVCHYFMK